MKHALVVAAILLCLATAAPAAETSAPRAGAAGECWALLIGINEYQAAGRLQFCREDAQALGKVLMAQGGFTPKRVVVLTDGGTQPEDWPTRGNIRRRIDQFATLAGPEDTVLLFFSGHGMMLDGQGYLMAVDSDRDPANNIALSWVKERLEGCKAKRKLLVLDVCHAGSAKDVGGLAPSLAGGAKALVVLASCAADQISYVDEKRGQGVFAGRLVEGLGGAADADGNSVVTLAELYGFVRQSMTDWCLQTGKTQSPALYPEPPPALVLARCDVRRSPAPGVRPESPAVRPSALRVPEGFRAKAGTVTEPYTNTGWAKEIVHEATGIEMVFIPAGTFLMGSPAAEEGHDDDETQHRVTISRPFYMGKYEVTQGEWQKVMGNSPRNFKGSDRLPVEEVSWNDCQEFFRKAGGGLRLPTEAEWEYACRAGTTTPFNTGETISTDEANYERSYLDGIGRKGGTVEVGSFRANAWGVFDMHGNVWEWCSDWYGPYPSGLVTDPTGAASGAKRVLRGGSWHLNPRKCRSALRGRDAPDNRNDNFGLRVALDF